MAPEPTLPFLGMSRDLVHVHVEDLHARCGQCLSLGWSLPSFHRKERASLQMICVAVDPLYSRSVVVEKASEVHRQKKVSGITGIQSCPITG